MMGVQTCMWSACSIALHMTLPVRNWMLRTCRNTGGVYCYPQERLPRCAHAGMFVCKTHVRTRCTRTNKPYPSHRSHRLDCSLQGSEVITDLPVTNRHYNLHAYGLGWTNAGDLITTLPAYALQGGTIVLAQTYYRRVYLNTRTGQRSARHFQTQP